jgi:hypothetical protein
MSNRYIFGTVRDTKSRSWTLDSTGQQQTADNRQQTTDNRQQTTLNTHTN